MYWFLMKVTILKIVPSMRGIENKLIASIPLRSKSVGFAFETVGNISPDTFVQRTSCLPSLFEGLDYCLALPPRKLYLVPAKVSAASHFSPNNLC
jgi:hypothetical protein